MIGIPLGSQILGAVHGRASAESLPPYSPLAAIVYTAGQPVTSKEDGVFEKITGRTTPKENPYSSKR